MANRLAVRGENLNAPRKRHHQRQHRRSRHMKVRQHRVCQLEAKARMNKEACETLDVAGYRPRLECARRTGADRDDAPADSTRMIDRGLRRGRNRVPLGLHRMTLDLDRAHRREGTGTDMQRDGRGADARVGQRFEDVVGEMQPGSGRRDRAGSRGIDGLVVVDVGGTDGAMYIMRESESAADLEYLLDRRICLAHDDRPPRLRIAGDSERVTVTQDETRVILE